MEDMTRKEYEELEELAEKFAETPPALSGKLVTLRNSRSVHLLANCFLPTMPELCVRKRLL